MGVSPLKLLKFDKILLVIIILLGLFLRVYKLDSVPPGLTWDEAALGYNAYSISQTLKDEYGNFLPLTLKSFGDYKPALYAYLIIPFLWVFGLTEIAVRLPSVFAGIGLIIVSFLLIRRVFKNNLLALAVAFFTAISPLSIQFSRAGWESNVAVFLNVTGLYLFIKGLQKPKYFIFSAVIFSLSLICYQASKIFVPILLFGLFLFFRTEIKKSKQFFAGLVLMALSLILVFTSTFIFGQSNRLAAQNFFAYTRTGEQIRDITTEDGFSENSLYFQFLHGDWWSYISGISERYFTYFSPKILFIEGDYSPRHSVPDLGILSLYGIILIPFGFLYLWRRPERERNIIIYWLLTASIPAVLSRDLISMVRALNLVFPIIILEGFGLYFLITRVSGLLHLKKIFVTASFILIVLLNLGLFADSYFIHVPKEYAPDWLYGYKQVIGQPYDFSKYDRVIFSDEYGQPYIYYLFYTKYPPKDFQKQAVLEQKTVDVGTIRKIDNIEFKKINWPADRGMENTLFIGTGEEIPDADIATEKKSKKLYEVKFPDDKTAFKVIENGYEN